MLSLNYRRICPFCSHELEYQAKVNGRLDPECSQDDLVNAWNSMGLGKHFSYYECKNCGALVNKYYPKGETVSSLYANMLGNMSQYVDENEQQANQLRYAKYISKHVKLNENLSILEIGGDRGFLAGCLSKIAGGRLLRYDCIEPNENVHIDLRKRLVKSAINWQISSAQINTALETEFSGIKYDIVIGIHVFDHLYNVSDHVKNISSYLRPGGILGFVVHNPRSVIARVMGKRWPPYCAQHPHLLTLTAVEEMASRLGLTLLVSKRTYNNFKLKMVSDYMGLQIGPLSRIPVQIPLGNRLYLLQKL